MSAKGGSSVALFPYVGDGVVGTTIGKYDVLEEIGRGGMGIVYLARQRGLERLVALKAVQAATSVEGGPGRALVEESRLASSLNHPNVVTVYEYIEEEGVPYVAMEYVPRGSLRPWIGCMSLAQLAGVLEDLLGGLAAVAPSGIVHRDLKPENLMVTADGHVKIADFGIAKATQRLGVKSIVATPTGITVGTPAYMAPEQALCDPVGPWTDLYSVGIITYEHLVGHVPFRDAGTPMAIMLRHINEDVPAPAEVDPRIDHELSDWVARLLEKDPTHRTQSAAAAWDELEEIVIDQLGPMWRRDARLTERARTRITPRRLDPEQFTSQRFTVEAVPDADPVITNVPLSAQLTRASPTIDAEPDRAPVRARRQAPRWAFAVAGVAAAVVGFAIAQLSGGASSTPRAHEQAGAVSVSLPARWQAISPAEPVPGYRMATPLTARPVAGGGAITLGVTRATSAALLPTGLSAPGHSSPKVEQVTLGGNAFFRYPNVVLRGSGGDAVVYTQPTSAGVLAALCRVPAPASAVTVGCEQVLGATTLHGAQALGLAAGEHYLTTLNDVIATFDSRRATVSAKLAAAANAPTQAHAATQLQTASTQAAGQLRVAAPGPSEAKANADAVKSLDRIASGYRQMAEGARTESHGLYQQGSNAVKSASASLEQTLRSIATSG